MPVSFRGTLVGWGIAFVVIIGLIAYLMYADVTPVEMYLPPAALPEVPDVVKTDYQWNMVDLEGKPFNLQELKGKPILLNVWATWCIPCIAELPSLQNLADNPKLKDYKIVCVAIAKDETIEEVRDFVKKSKIKLPVYYTKNEAVPEQFQSPGIPTSFVINADGKIVAVEMQAAQWDKPEVADRLISLAGVVRKSSALEKDPVPSE